MVCLLFKIEGRLKEEDYVKNVVSFTIKRINELIKSRPNEYIRSSSGTSVCSFDPKWTRVLIGDLPLIFLSPVDQPLLHHY